MKFNARCLICTKEYDKEESTSRYKSTFCSKECEQANDEEEDIVQFIDDTHQKYSGYIAELDAGEIEANGQTSLYETMTITSTIWYHTLSKSQTIELELHNITISDNTINEIRKIHQVQQQLIDLTFTILYETYTLPASLTAYTCKQEDGHRDIIFRIDLEGGQCDNDLHELVKKAGNYKF